MFANSGIFHEKVLLLVKPTSILRLQVLSAASLLSIHGVLRSSAQIVRSLPLSFLNPLSTMVSLRAQACHIFLQGVVVVVHCGWMRTWMRSIYPWKVHRKAFIIVTLVVPCSTRIALRMMVTFVWRHRKSSSAICIYFRISGKDDFVKK
jgi:hypothetical protein